MKQFSYIDIFAGCGGLSLGLHNAGWKGLFAIEKSKDAFATLKYNLIEKRRHFCWKEDYLRMIQASNSPAFDKPCPRQSSQA